MTSDKHIPRHDDDDDDGGEPGAFAGSQVTDVDATTALARHLVDTAHAEFMRKREAIIEASPYAAAYAKAVREAKVQAHDDVATLHRVLIPNKTTADHTGTVH
jgi:hypothetical protein